MAKKLSSRGMNNLYMNHNATHILSKSSIDIILEICKLVESVDYLEDSLSPALMILADSFRLEECALTLFEQESNEIYIDLSYGLSGKQHSRGRYKPGEGITGEVFLTGKSKIVPKITLEPKFLNKAKSRTNEYSFICVPINYEKKTHGTLSITMLHNTVYNLEEIVKLLKIITIIIARPLIFRKQMIATIKQRSHSVAQNTNNKSFETIIGNSKEMRALKDHLYPYIKNDTPILFTGENGTGKTFLASMLHHNSIRKNAPLLYCSCASMREKDLYAFLFGTQHANTMRKTINITYTSPLLPKGDQTSILIEEITLMPLNIQEIIVDILEGNDYQIDGIFKKCSARFIFTASTNIKDLMEKGKFNKKFYEILAQHTLPIPSLRNRKDDIMLFVDHFLKESTIKQNKNIKRLSTPAITLLSTYHWPGNLNEMQKIIEDSVRFCENSVIYAYMLPPKLTKCREL